MSTPVIAERAVKDEEHTHKSLNQMFERNLLLALNSARVGLWKEGTHQKKAGSILTEKVILRSSTC